MADKIDERECIHETCTCRVAGDDDYCSPQCEAAESGEVMSITCKCGHPACGGEMHT